VYEGIVAHSGSQADLSQLLKTVSNQGLGPWFHLDRRPGFPVIKDLEAFGCRLDRQPSIGIIAGTPLPGRQSNFIDAALQLHWIAKSNTISVGFNRLCS
jgi:hypothetical protein